MTKFSLSLMAAAVLLSTGGTANAAAEADSSAHWTSCGVGYSEHLSSKSDAGSDVKLGQLSCSRTSAAGVVQTFELGAQADTPPDGRRNTTMTGGVRDTVSGLPSNQLDTFETFAGFGEEFDTAPGSAMMFNVRGGSINGFSTPLVRGFIDDTHRWEGKGYSRHSPVSTDGRPLVQLSGTHTSELFGADLHHYRVRLSDVENVTVGSALDALNVGLQLSAQTAGTAPVLPSGLPGMPLRLPEGTSVYAGVYAQSTAYDVATVNAGAAREYLYAKAGASVALGNHVVLAVEYTHPLTERVRQQYIDGYDYVGASLGYRF
ncbi:hypothetical protein G3A43_07255 [Paraburkholderia aspalathi]|nr:hypothetical protein [Paraburkholderia aspalathi]MBK3780050.1 hypothetical protein [Paraburkholderia aspalathi]